MVDDCERDDGNNWWDSSSSSSSLWWDDNLIFSISCFISFLSNNQSLFWSFSKFELFFPSNKWREIVDKEDELRTIQYIW